MLLLGQKRPGADNVQRCEHVQRGQERCSLRTHVLRKLTQNTLYLLVLLGNIALDVIVQIHHGQRLDKQRCTRAALVVYNAGEIHLVFLLDGDNVAVTTHSDDIIHKIFLIIGVVQDAVQLFLNAVLGNLYSVAQAAKLRRSVVLQLTVLINRTGNLLFQTAEDRQLAAILCQVWRSLGHFCYKILHRRKGLHRRQNVQQLLRLQHAAKLCALNIGSNIISSSKGKASAIIQNAQRLCRFLLQAFNLAKLSFNLQGNNCLLAQKSGSLRRQHIFYFIKLQRFNRITRHYSAPLNP